MPIDKKLFNGAATRGDVAEVALYAKVIAKNVTSALRLLGQGGADIGDCLNEIDAQVRELDHMFIRLVGWRDEP